MGASVLNKIRPPPPHVSREGQSIEQEKEKDRTPPCKSVRDGGLAVATTHAAQTTYPLRKGSQQWQKGVVPAVVGIMAGVFVGVLCCHPWSCRHCVCTSLKFQEQKFVIAEVVAGLCCYPPL
jgi:hypothetical protein